LIAHELTHVVQQNGSAVQRSPQPKEQHQKHPATETLSASVKAVQMRAEPIGGAVQGMVTAKRKSFDFPVVQRLIGAGNQPGDSVQLPENQNEPLPESVGAAAKKSALYINRRARIGTNGPVAKSSALGENNPGNLHLDSLFNDGNGLSHLETWTELTPLGGGYVKRVRITRLGQTVMDRVMNETPGTAFQQALIADRQANGLAGGQHFASVHGVHSGDTDNLNTLGYSERDADNFTKMVGEGARFGWLADRLSKGTIGNQSKNLLNIRITIPQEGTFEIDPTFQQLWGAWDSAFGRRYIKDKDVAKVILKKRLTEGWRSAKDSDVPGAAPLASGVTAAGQVTSLLRKAGGIALMPANGRVNGAQIVTDLGMTWTSSR
jgi:hypothetical protein